MTTFTLDTSGVVEHWRDNKLGVKVGPTYWSDLDAFTQGYVEALFASLPRNAIHGLPIAMGTADVEGHFVGFSDLSREALAMILADCAAFRDQIAWRLNLTQEVGAKIWRARQADKWSPTFPPLTVSLGDDGKVRLS
jgi:hypothetical protein